jgi:dephospho-CoA kinase
MSAWPGKYVIGLTGNIAAGKSEVRRMLQKLGAYGIDADVLAHQSIAKGEPAYAAVLESFGDSILSSDGQIDRPRLGEIVFSDPAALARLEAIIHPEVRKMVDRLVRQANAPVVVIEAIKLLEAGYRQLCDSIWVAAAPEQIQIDRLMERRGMSEAGARQRILAQPAQAEKVAAANVIIYNDESLEKTWRQVSSHWEKIFPLP